MDDWDFEIETPTFQEKLQATGLLNLARFKYQYLNKTLLTAFIERWHPETNTFHLPFGEMTITLDDVDHILGIPISGHSIYLRPLGGTSARNLVVEMLDLQLEDVAAEMKLNRGHTLSLNWLSQNLMGYSYTATPEELDCIVRGYVLYLLGCTLFADKTGKKVFARYLTLLGDVENIKDFSWGAAALAILYRQLGCASRKDVTQIAGYLPLLQVCIN